MVNNAMIGLLRSAYGGEYTICDTHLGKIARKEGFNIGTLWGYWLCEYVHANNHFNVLKEQKGDYTVPTGGLWIEVP